MVIWAWPLPFSSKDCEVILETPRTCWIAASRGDVRSASVVSGEAPAHDDATVRRGSVVSGRSSIGILRQVAIPRSATVRYAIEIATDRRSEIRTIIILLNHLPVAGSAPRPPHPWGLDARQWWHTSTPRPAPP